MVGSLTESQAPPRPMSSLPVRAQTGRRGSFAARTSAATRSTRATCAPEVIRFPSSRKPAGTVSTCFPDRVGDEAGLFFQPERPGGAKNLGPRIRYERLFRAGWCLDMGVICHSRGLVVKGRSSEREGSFQRWTASRECSGRLLRAGVGMRSSPIRNSRFGGRGDGGRASVAQSVRAPAVVSGRLNRLFRLRPAG
jgi:hypothetical protein